MKCQETKELKKYRILYEIYPHSFLEITSDTEKGLMKDFFSSSLISNKNITEKNVCQIYNFSTITCSYENKNKTARIKKLEKGYYNLHHFGDKVIHFVNNNKYYFFGAVKDCNIAIWTFFIKWLVTYKLAFNFVHLKGTVVTYKNNGILVIGDKGSGKSTFVYELTKHSTNTIGLLANTHIILQKKCVANGIFSSINFRKSIAQRIKEEHEDLANLEIKGCTNIDPVYLNCKKETQATINKIIFYTHNEDGNCQIQKVSSRDMLNLIYLYSYAISFYSLQNDLTDFCKSQIKDIVKKLNTDAEILNQTVENCQLYSVNFDVFTANNWEKIINILEE